MGRALRSMTRLFPKTEVVETEAGHFLQEEVPDGAGVVFLCGSRGAHTQEFKFGCPAPAYPTTTPHVMILL